jgi:hypothetical protein
MLREFTINELWFLVLAARWTVLLSAIAFMGGGARAHAVRERLPRRDLARLHPGRSA